jgi:hypothetical protein
MSNKNPLFAISVTAIDLEEHPVTLSPIYCDERPKEDWIITQIARGALYNNSIVDAPHIIFTSDDEVTWKEFGRFDCYGNSQDKLEFPDIKPEHSFVSKAAMVDKKA